MKKISFIIFAVIILLVGQSYAWVSANRSDTRYIPEPRLVAPTKEKVILKEKDLEFKWSPHEGREFGREYYDFRLYKGYDMKEATLIFKKKVSPNIYSISLEASLFEDNHVYTWSLRQIYSGIGKSDRSFQSFKVIKDGAE